MSTDPVIGFRFKVTHPNGRVETFTVDAERALIGSAAHCEVRLDPEIAAHEHVELYTNAGLVYFATRPYGLAMRAPTLNGAMTVEGTWPPGAILAIGNTQMTVEVVDIGTAKAKPPYWALLYVVPGVIITVITLIFLQAPPVAERPIPNAPALLPPKDASLCRNVAPDQRAALAVEKNRIGLAMRERSPFAPHDGLEAVLYFEAAASCYRGAGMTADAAEADQAADALRVKLDEDYRARRVRLEHSYRVHDVPAMKRELPVLLSLTTERRGAYTEWLGAIDRGINGELAKKGSLF